MSGVQYLEFSTKFSTLLKNKGQSFYLEINTEGNVILK